MLAYFWLGIIPLAHVNQTICEMKLKTRYDHFRNVVILNTGFNRYSVPIINLRR